VRTFKEKTKFPFIYPKTFYKLTNLYKEEIGGIRTQKKLINYAIEMRKKKKSPSDVENLMIDRFLENRDKFDDVEVVDLLNNIMQSVDSFGNFIANTILLLAMHPEVQLKLQDELQSVVGDGNYDSLSADNANKLKYMEMVMKESMRLIPQIPIMSREVLDDFEIEPGVIIPKSTTLVMSLLMLHRNKTYWGEDAEDFRPERFSEENWVPGSNFFVPFSAGQRICIGMKFSYVAGKIILARLLHKYKYSTSLTTKDLSLDNFESLIVYKFKLPHTVKVVLRQ
jgi:cytochrome P450 family 4